MITTWAALGSCVLTTIDSLIERNGHAPKLIKISVEKRLTENDKINPLGNMSSR